MYAIRSYYAPVDLQPDRPATRIDPATRLRQLAQCGVDEFLAAESRVDGHQQYQVDRVERVVQPVERRRRIEYEAGPAAAVADHLDGPVDVPARLRVESYNFV